MKANRTSWNKFVFALSGIFLLWIVAPRHDCFCGTMQVSKSESSIGMHDCCEKDDEQLSIAKANHSIQSESCACANEHLVFCETTKVQSHSQAGKGQLPQNVVVAEMLPLSVTQAPLFSQIQRRNDELKPSKLFILKRALLI